MTASIDSLKLSSKNASVCSSKHASSESVLSRKEKECLQMQECKKKLLAMEPQIIIRDENVVLRSPPQKKIVMPPTINPEVSVKMKILKRYCTYLLVCQVGLRNVFVLFHH